jgi:hypothetical protein
MMSPTHSRDTQVLSRQLDMETILDQGGGKRRWRSDVQHGAPSSPPLNYQSIATKIFGLDRATLSGFCQSSRRLPEAAFREDY